MRFEIAIMLGMIDVLAENFGCALTPTPLPEGEGICSLLPRGEGPRTGWPRAMRAVRNLTTRRFHIPP